MPAHAPPPAYTPLIALPVLVVDLETTGLDVRNDRVVQIGAIAMVGAAEQETPRLDRIIDPGVTIPPRVTRVHGLDDASVAGAPRFSDVAPSLLEMLHARCAVGHHVGFDLALLRHEAARAGLPWQDVPMLDIAQLAAALDPTLRDLELESVLATLGIRVEGRHSAMGDCRATAQAWIRLQGMLRGKGIRTLGEAQAFSARRGDIARNEAEAGWATTLHAGAHTPSLPAGAEHRIDRYAFERRLSDLMRTPALTIHPGASLRDAARTMIDQRIGALLVGEAALPPIGILTERDLLRIVAQDSSEAGATPVTAAMSAPVATMHAEELLYRALARMDRLGIRHLCVVDRTGAALGVVSQRDLLQHRARGADMLSDELGVAHDAPTLAAAYARLPAIASRLVSEGLDGPGIAHIVATELRALMARVAELAATRLRAQGRGPAPAPWCLLVLGSGGRSESLLAADQDNALIHAGKTSDDAWFSEFGTVIAELLDAAGVRYCPGGVMISNPEWRGTVEQWSLRIDNWLNRPRLRDLLKMDIFFDFTPVAGDAELARVLQSDAIRMASATPGFIGAMAASATSFAPRFNMFGRLVTTDGRADLKRDGLLSLVKVARTLALRSGSHARSTPQRLRDAQAAGRLPEGDATTLIELHVQLLTRIVDQQVADLRDGIPPSGRVILRSIDRRQRTRLMRGLQTLDAVTRDLRAAVSG